MAYYSDEDGQLLIRSMDDKEHSTSCFFKKEKRREHKCFSRVLIYLWAVYCDVAYQERNVDK